MNPPTPIDLPPLSEEAIDRIEQSVFAEIAEQRRDDRIRVDATRTRSRRRGWLTAAGIAAAFVVGVLVTPALLNATGSVTASSSSAGSAEPQPAAPEAKSLNGSPQDLAATGTAGGSSSGSASSSAPNGRDVVRTASATVQVDDVRTAVAAIAALAEKHSGYVESQQIGGGGAVPLESAGASPLPRADDGWVTIRVPAGELATVMDALRSQGTVVQSAISANDVTAATTDLQAQVDSLTTSVQRLRDLMAQATSVSDLLTAETALTERQGQLQSAQQQLAGLQSQVAMSSVQVSLVHQAPATADPAGFGDGLAAGWNGLIASINALVIAIGFLLPWIAVAAIVAIVVWGVVRARRTRRTRRATLADEDAAAELG
ncbi:MAG: DUF4349 domain-containing protein [Actinobacteria bacterium]|nr:DUF4349 domain-containing protein [Actinomycetota bacterium]